MSENIDKQDNPFGDSDKTITEKPNTARIYDYLLGGYHNFEPDRAAAEAILKIYPELKHGALANRAFLRRAVRFLAARGIDQYLDIGSGIPTVGNVHEVAGELVAEPHVVYVDIDPVAVAYSGEILRNTPSATAIIGDLSKPTEIIDNPETRSILDFKRPIGLIMVSVVHFVLDDQVAYKVVRELIDHLVSDSYVALLHATMDDIPADLNRRLTDVIAASNVNSRYRTFDEIKLFFGGLEMIEPGLVRPPLWRPEGSSDPMVDKPERVFGWAGVARKG